jgi:tetratricopeptide (TPR) repeat protein
MGITGEDIRVVVGLLRLLDRRNLKEMAAAAGMHYSTISRYETGTKIPSKDELERLAGAASLPAWSIEGFLLPVLLAVRRLARSNATLLPCDADRFRTIFREEASSPRAAGVLAEFLTECSLSEDVAYGGRAARGEDAPSDLDPWAETSRRMDVGHATDAHLWFLFEGLVVQMCTESEHAAADDAARSLDLARRALSVAQMAPGEAAWRHRLGGYAQAFVGNALRVGSELLAADGCFVSAWRLWRAGAAAPQSGLAEWRLLDLEASLRRDRRQFVAALDLLERARRLAPPEAQGRILLKKGFTFEQAGKIEAALATLREAAPLLDAAREPRQLWLVQINLLVSLCHLGRFTEAERELPALERLTEESGNELDRLRVRWLGARVAAGLGCRDVARRGFEEVRREFATRNNAYDAALASLELAILYLEEGWSAEVKTLAGEMVWIFASQGVHREALAALKLFCQAVEAETVTASLARRVLHSVEHPHAGTAERTS